MESRVKLFGHAIHPMLIPFPLGLGLGGVTGWLGGELVERLGVGVDDGANLNAPSSLSGKAPHGKGGRVWQR